MHKPPPATTAARSTTDPAFLAAQSKLNNDLLTEAQVVAYLKVAVRTLRRWVAEDKFPRPMKAGGWTRWSVQQIEEWQKKLLEEAARQGRR